MKVRGDADCALGGGEEGEGMAHSGAFKHMYLHRLQAQACPP